MTDTMPVSVVVPVRNGAATIGELLHALEQQAPRPGPTEVIVVDNGSTDDTREVVAQHNVTLLTESTPGPSAARNCGLRHASGDVVVHTDADAVPSRRWLNELVAAFDDPSVVLAAGRTVSFPPATAAERYVAASALFETDLMIAREEFPFAPSVNIAVRRAAAEAVGGWSEDMPTGEDADFCHRVLAAYPGSIAYRPAAVLMHHHRADDDALRRQARDYGSGVARVYRRYPDEVPWTWRRTFAVVRLLAARTVRPLVLRARRAPAADLEFARYDRLWAWSFWRAFAGTYRAGG